MAMEMALGLACLIRIRSSYPRVATLRNHPKHTMNIRVFQLALLADSPGLFTIHHVTLLQKLSCVLRSGQSKSRAPEVAKDFLYFAHFSLSSVTLKLKLQISINLSLQLLRRELPTCHCLCTPEQQLNMRNRVGNGFSLVWLGCAEGKRNLRPFRPHYLTPRTLSKPHLPFQAIPMTGLCFMPFSQAP